MEKVPNINHISDLLNQIRQGIITTKHVEAILERRNPFEPLANFQIWQRVKVGTFKNIKQLSRALKRNGFKYANIEKFGQSSFQKPDIILSSQEELVELVIVSIPDLGFNFGPLPYRYIYMRAKELGLEFCPIEVGPQLGLQCKEYLKNYPGKLIVARKSPYREGSEGPIDVFVSNKDYLCYESIYNSTLIYPGDLKIIFCLSR